MGCAVAQAAAARVAEEEATVPGAPPGIYACAYRPLAAILALLAEARLASASGNHTGAEVPDILAPCAQQPVVRALHVKAQYHVVTLPARASCLACVSIRTRGGACCMAAQVVGPWVAGSSVVPCRALQGGFHGSWQLS